MFWFWGMLFLFGPTYAGAHSSLVAGGWHLFTNLVGFALITIGCVGALIEFGRLTRNEALEYWGAATLFLVPALLLHIVAVTRDHSDRWDTAARVGVLGLAAIGVPLMLYGCAFVVWHPELGTESGGEGGNQPVRPRSDDIKAWLSLVVAIASAITALLKLAL